MSPDTLPEYDVIAAFGEVVGLPRREVARHLVARCRLEERSLAAAPGFGVDTAWRAFVQILLRHYNELVADPAGIRAHRWNHNIELLAMARHRSCKTALATMSHCAEADRVLDVLELRSQFDSVATRDDVAHGKPDPEIYLLVANELKSTPAQCLVVEDSPTGVAAAVGAGMRCVAVATPFTRDALHAGGLIDERWIVDDPAELTTVVAQRYSTEGP